jgi:hypothetical protein
VTISLLPHPYRRRTRTLRPRTTTSPSLFTFHHRGLFNRGLFALSLFTSQGLFSLHPLQHPVSNTPWHRVRSQKRLHALLPRVRPRLTMPMTHLMLLAEWR